MRPTLAAMSCASGSRPAAVATAAGLHVSRLAGSPLVYNNADPYLPDLLICRPELAAGVLAQFGGVTLAFAFIARLDTETTTPRRDLILTGLFAGMAVLAALRHRDATGQGQFVDLALFDCGLASLTWAWVLTV